MHYIKGDLLATDCRVIIHGCNAQGKMGAGVALAIKNKYAPQLFGMYNTYLDAFRSCCRDEAEYESTIIGRSVLFYDPNTDTYIENLISQINYGNDGKIYASVPGIIKGLDTIIKYHSTVKEFAIPKIGCGLGGLQWSSLEHLLLALEKKHKINFYVYEL